MSAKTGREWLEHCYNQAITKHLPMATRAKAALDFVELIESAGGMSLLTYEPAVPTPRATKQAAMLAGEVIMPFGKHRGQKLKTLPTNYLQWMVDKLDAPLKLSAREVLSCRDDAKPVQRDFDFETAPRISHGTDHDPQPFCKKPDHYEELPDQRDYGDFPF